MLKRYAAFIILFRSLTDIIMLACIWIAVFYIRYYSGLFAAAKGVSSFKNHIILLLPVVLICYLGCHLAGIYKTRRIQNMFTQFSSVFKAVILSSLLIIFFFYYTANAPYSRKLLIIFFILMFFGLMSSHLITMAVFRKLRAKGYNLRYYAVIGSGPRGQQLVQDIEQASWLGLKCVFFIDNQSGSVTSKAGIIPVYSPIEKIRELIKTETIDEIYLAMGGEEAQKAYPILEDIQAAGITVRIIPDWGKLVSISHFNTIMIGSQILFSAGDSPLSGINAILKDSFDRVSALLLLLILFIPMVLIGIIIKLTSKGNVFFLQQRVGLDMKEFKVIKFRTMKEQAGNPDIKEWSMPDNPRCTRFGKILRRTSFDELPQLINVLKGEMSLVGPRPERPVFIKQFSDEYKKYMLRHKVKTGMTGWAQVNSLRGNTSIRKRLLYDLYYVKNWSWWLDIWILILTPLQIIKGKNAY